jgi:hypothetical protein
MGMCIGTIKIKALHRPGPAVYAFCNDWLTNLDVAMCQMKAHRDNQAGGLSLWG